MVELELKSTKKGTIAYINMDKKKRLTKKGGEQALSVRLQRARFRKVYTLWYEGEQLVIDDKFQWSRPNLVSILESLGFELDGKGVKAL